MAEHQSPTLGASRIDSLDVLRGLAVLMIFVVNIKMMASGYNHYADRTLWEGEYDQVIGYLHSVFVHGKFVTIFTALFGASLALLLAREKPVSLSVVISRLFWLAVFGAIHLIFIREGDILIKYALVGFVAILFVRMSGPTLLALGAALQIVLFVGSILFPVEYNDVPILWQDGPKMHLEVERIMLGSMADQVAARIDAVRFYMWDLLIINRGWLDYLSVMIIGMWLLKNGFLTCQLSPKTYFLLCAVGAACAFGLIAARLLGIGGSPLEDTIINGLWSLHRFGGALFWSALTIGAVAHGWKAQALAAVGRTAFTVYILQSVIGLVLFSSLGLGLFGQLSLRALTLITVAVCAGFLIASPIWLAHFRFGPLEWLWRSLTYSRLQPFLR
ncbi:DUF418 domain-containing protein [Erythrobacter sp. YT30]|uniref:DUF418 domain-containing protein n=1 Tax=Erythrobacter sp. YT30 TaxID=1735012 RepID=UPI00076DE45C|nr:DUF418 domain-containing protein [Erythrobacter sp. YT30]KWV92013.1 hypothetical protein AUC45_12730 [Erythrobacter sp. YT30]